MSWLDTVPVCTTAYAFQADLICEDCAAKVMDRLDKKDVEDDGDTDTYPQESPEEGGGESDSASFCGSGRYCVNAVAITSKNKVGCPLGNALTSYGRDALVESIHRDLLSEDKFSRRLGRLLYRVWGEYARNSPTRGGLLPTKLPASLRKLPPKTGHLDAGASIMIDCENVYLAGKPGQDTVALVRCPVNDEGEFEQFDVAVVPLDLYRDYDPQTLLTHAINDMAWD